MDKIRNTKLCSDLGIEQMSIVLKTIKLDGMVMSEWEKTATPPNRLWTTNYKENDCRKDPLKDGSNMLMTICRKSVLV